MRCNGWLRQVSQQQKALISHIVDPDTTEVGVAMAERAVERVRADETRLQVGDGCQGIGNVE